MRLLARLLPLAAPLCFLVAQPLQCASLKVYISDPNAQATYVPGAITETFSDPSLSTSVNRTTPYTSALGVYELGGGAAFRIRNANHFGGANSSRYMGFGSQSNTSQPVTLDLNDTYKYFGFWWSAGDNNNGLTFYNDDLMLARFSTADINALLNRSVGPMVTAVNGTTYNKADYFGNPNTGGNTSEAYAYVHFFAAYTSFNRIVFDNSGTTTSGFESDNHSVSKSRVAPHGTTVLVRDVPAAAVGTEVPEPSTYALLVTGLLGVVAMRRQRS